ncbi:MAG TPA: hypothetical protein VGO11_21485, partial [Chthoniobacteraceae bacterium]|nr:hypothetical protein [Chthoniobacteraceae bacterium]
ASNIGRPSLRTPETVLKICAAIRQRGHSDTHAAALAGVSSTAVSRWRQEDEEFALLLDTARADYLDVRLQVINETRKRDGSLDWRAQAWLMQVAAPETYGTPSRRFSLARAKEEKECAEAKAKADEGKVFTPEIMASHQQWHAYSVAKMNGASEEEARWLGHFLHHDPKPVFPGSLAIAGAEIGPGPEYTPQELAELAKYRARRDAAKRATAERAAAERRAEGEAVGEDGEKAPAGGEAVNPGKELSRPRAGLQNEANVPESRAVSNATIVPETRDSQRNCRRDADTPNGAAREAAEALRRRAATDAYVDKLLAGPRSRNPAEANGANVPESRAEEDVPWRMEAGGLC